MTIRLSKCAKQDWMEDEQSNNCLCCLESFNWITRRKHHCRSCGILVCYSCSQHSVFVDGYDSKQRICDKCYNTATSAAESQSNISQSVNTTINDSNDTTISHLTIPSPTNNKNNKISLSSNTSISSSPNSSYSRADRYARLRQIKTMQTPNNLSGLITSINNIPYITSNELFNDINSLSAMLLLDIRSSEVYNQGHLSRAINIPINTEIINNKFNLSQIEEMLNYSELKLFQRRPHQNIIIYSSNNETIENQIFLLNVLKIEGKVTNISILQDGYNEFIKYYPFLICFNENSEIEHIHKNVSFYPTEVISHFLYLGNYNDAENKLHLKELQISNIFNISNEINNLFPSEFIYTNYKLNDENNVEIFQYFNEINEKLFEIEQLNKRCLIHCYQGVSRSVTFIISYLMYKYNITLFAAFSYLKRRRKQSMPNYGFWKQLEQYEQYLFNKSKYGLKNYINENLNEKDREQIKKEQYNSTLSQCIDINLFQQQLN